MKRFLTLFLAALLVAGLCAGCGKKPQETQEYTVLIISASFLSRKQERILSNILQKYE